MTAPDHDDQKRRAPDLAEAIGGPLGAAETALPGIAFVVAYTATGQDTELSAIVAVASAAVLAVVRLVKRQTPRHALAGLVGVVFAAFVATRSGKAENFFLPGLLLNAAYAAGLLISLAIRRPLIGLIVGQLDASAGDWRTDPSRRRAVTQATWMWSGLFLVRLAVQLPLYLAGAVVALGIARTAMGIPLFALGIWLTWLLVRNR
jgi:intracellular septation protein A